MLDVTPEFVFLPGDDEDANQLLARFHEEFLAPGPVGWEARADAMRWLLEHSWLPPLPWKQQGTTCALYQGSAMQCAGVQARRKVNPKYAITTWLKVGGFHGAEWIPRAKLDSGEENIIRGDLPYWCGGDAHSWPDAKNGHVGCALTGRDFEWATAEGGGAKGVCRLSAGPKDISTSFGRPLRGVWRPNLMTSNIWSQST